mgnify:CR=1 FL=1
MDLRTKNAIKWIDALRPEVGFRKTISKLGQMDEQGKMSYCCLGVACRTMEYTDIDFNAPTNDDLVDDLGLHDREGSLRSIVTQDGCVEKPSSSWWRLTMINDKAFGKDFDFKNMRDFIIKNIRFLFVKEVAEELNKHYNKN